MLFLFDSIKVDEKARYNYIVSKNTTELEIFGNKKESIGFERSPLSLIIPFIDSIIELLLIEFPMTQVIASLDMRIIVKQCTV